MEWTLSILLICSTVVGVGIYVGVEIVKLIGFVDRIFEE